MQVLVGFISLIIVHIAYGIDKDCVKWGNKFDVPLDGNNLHLDCLLPTGKAVCCEATDRVSLFGSTSNGVGNIYIPDQSLATSSSQSRNPEKCVIEKSYHSSPQEIRDFEYSMKLQEIDDFDTRSNKLLDYVTSAEVIANSTKWLSRVSYHMNNQVITSSDPSTHHPDDKEFLSYFLITKSCALSGKSSWIEWIEPVTITARHPFGFGRCRPTAAYYKNKGEHMRGSQRRVSVSRSNVDYVLLQSGVNIYQHTHDKDSIPQSSTTTIINRGKDLHSFNSTEFSSLLPQLSHIENVVSRPPKFYMLDSGTSTFDSSLYWFTCGYSQNKISFNQVYAWELTLLEPNDYWSRVPAKWIPHWHFYNAPISSVETDFNSPVRHIKSIATPDDFVAFKLDIDTPSVEMPIALELLKDPILQSLVDEFFFELHFQCEIMTSCGWGKRVPKESHGLVLDRPHALKFFIELRQSGIRAHIWP